MQEEEGSSLPDQSTTHYRSSTQSHHNDEYPRSIADRQTVRDSSRSRDHLHHLHLLESLFDHPPLRPLDSGKTQTVDSQRDSTNRVTGHISGEWGGKDHNTERTGFSNRSFMKLVVDT